MQPFLTWEVDIMAVKFAVNKLREKAQRLHREYDALCVFNNMLTANDRNRFELEKHRFGEAKKDQLRRIIKQLEDAITDLRRDFGFRVPNSELVKILDKVEGLPKGKVLRMSKSLVKRHLHWVQK